MRLPLLPLALSHINAYNIRSFPTPSGPSLDKNFKTVLWNIWRLNSGKYLVLQLGQTEVIVATSCAFKSKINLRARFRLFLVLTYDFSHSLKGHVPCNLGVSTQETIKQNLEQLVTVKKCQDKNLVIWQILCLPLHYTEFWWNCFSLLQLFLPFSDKGRILKSIKQGSIRSFQLVFFYELWWTFPYKHIFQGIWSPGPFFLVQNRLPLFSLGRQHFAVRRKRRL